jgi:hypothetical protein
MAGLQCRRRTADIMNVSNKILSATKNGQKNKELGKRSSEAGFKIHKKICQKIPSIHVTRVAFIFPLERTILLVFVLLSVHQEKCCLKRDRKSEMGMKGAILNLRTAFSLQCMDTTAQPGQMGGGTGGPFTITRQAFQEIGDTKKIEDTKNV